MEVISTKILGAWLLASYLIGSIPFGVVISRIVAKKDVRTHGSGNIGATNVSRLMGKKWGVVVLVLDALKGFLVVSLAKGAELPWPVVCAVGMIAVVGHCFPIFLKFRGGKGVATALGVLLALSPLATLVCFLTFAFSIATTRIVSASSLAAGASLIATSFFLTSAQIPLWVALGLATLIWYKHRENIVRLINRQEPRFF